MEFKLFDEQRCQVEHCISTRGFIVDLVKISYPCNLWDLVDISCLLQWVKNPEDYVRC